MFAAYVFTALYIAGKLGVFSAKGRAQSPRLVVAIAPLLVAVLVGISRLRDRRHHPEGEASTADTSVKGKVSLLGAVLQCGVLVDT